MKIFNILQKAVPNLRMNYTDDSDYFNIISTYIQTNNIFLVAIIEKHTQNIQAGKYTPLRNIHNKYIRKIFESQTGFSILQSFWQL